MKDIIRLLHSKISKQIDKEQHWIWKGGTGLNSTVPQFRMNGEMRYVKNILYEIVFGRMPEFKGIRMKCNEPNCVNPEHMELVDLPKYNIEEEHSKLLSLGKVNFIREAVRGEFFTQAEICRKFNISKQMVNAVLKNKLYRSSNV